MGVTGACKQSSSYTGNRAYVFPRKAGSNTRGNTEVDVHVGGGESAMPREEKGSPVQGWGGNNDTRW